MNKKKTIKKKTKNEINKKKIAKYQYCSHYILHGLSLNLAT